MKVELDLTMPEENQLTGISEFARARWSIINAEGCAASNLSYAEAVARLREMSGEIAGLCIVTDEAAARLCGENDQAAHELPAPEKFSETL